MGTGPTVLIANPSADVYGSDLQMLESLQALIDAHYRVVVAIPSDGPLVPRIRERGGEVDFIDFPVLSKSHLALRSLIRLVWQATTAIPRLVRYIRRTAPGAVYVNTVTLPWWQVASRLAGKPTICHLHEAEAGESVLVRRALVMPLRLAHEVVVNSQSTMDFMVGSDHRLAKRASLVYNGVPQAPTTPDPARRETPLRLISVGRLSPRKATLNALEAVGVLRSQGYDLDLELAGTAFAGYEWYVRILEDRAAESDLAGAVTFSGYCSPIWGHLSGADIVVQPSLGESFGNAVVEAQYALRPVVATRALGHTETITDGETGLLVPPGDVPALAAAIARLADDPELSGRIARTARSEAIRRFSVDRYNSEVVALFDRLTHRGARS